MTHAVDGRRAVRRAAEPRSPLGRDRVGRGSDRRPRERARAAPPRRRERRDRRLRRDPVGLAQQVRVRRGARRHRARPAALHRDDRIRATTATSRGRSPRTATRSTRSCSSPTRRSPAAGSASRADRRLPHVDQKGPDEKLAAARGRPRARVRATFTTCRTSCATRSSTSSQRYKDLEPSKRTETRGWGNRTTAAADPRRLPAERRLDRPQIVCGATGGMIAPMIQNRQEEPELDEHGPQCSCAGTCRARSAAQRQDRRAAARRTSCTQR